MVVDQWMKDAGGASLGPYATVSQEWQRLIEQHTFSRIKLNTERLVSFRSCLSPRKQLYVKYIWFCWELEEYECSACAPQERLDEMPAELPSRADNLRIKSALETIFGVLGTYPTTCDLVLDISVHSHSDSEHGFEHLSFEPDVTMDREKLEKLESRDGEGPQEKCRPRRNLVPSPESTISTVFGKIMDRRNFENDAEEALWWRQWPSVPAVKSVLLLRQQTRRRWNPRLLGRMFSRFPRLQEVNYEPWREWDSNEQEANDKGYESLSESVVYANPQVQRITLFENVNESYADTLIRGHPGVRHSSVTTPASRAPPWAV